MDKFLGGVLVALVIAGGVFVFTRTESVPAAPPSGAAGSEFSSKLILRDNVVVGGNTFATSSRGSVTYTAASIVNTRLIEHNAEAATTATFPTNALLSSAGFLPSPGDTASLFIHASTTQITLAGGTGVTLSSASSTKVVLPNTTARVECARLGATEGRIIQCLMTAASN
ncbi:MAG: hypothetical protein KBD16_00620 [Candidatus Pacebacteria bacterium]|nr:hypothetical protein [Candidatus Paceibacterota bacterium]